MVFQRNAARVDRTMLFFISLVLLTVFHEISSPVPCGSATKLSRNVGNFVYFTSCFSTKFCPQIPFWLDFSLIEPIVFQRNFVDFGQISTKSCFLWGFQRKFVYSTSCFSTKFRPLPRHFVYFVYEISLEIAFRQRTEIREDEILEDEISMDEISSNPP